MELAGYATKSLFVSSLVAVGVAGTFSANVTGTYSVPVAGTVPVSVTVPLLSTENFCLLILMKIFY